jgi:hypothetical protein
MERDELQLAEIKLVRVRQELEQKYGHYDQVRRTATGILQAIDLSLVRSSIVKSVTEEMMITTPKYWLAPALVALTGWLNDQQDLAERALEEAMRRNSKKTSLFFALVSRRYNRQVACRQWFEHYFQEINPMEVDRDMVMVIDGITNGVFPLSITTAFTDQSTIWKNELTSNVELKTAEREEWRDALFQRIEYPLMDEKYPYLVKNSLTWDKISYSAQIVQYHEEIGNYLGSVLKQDIEPSPQVEVAIDNLLEKLVFQYEDNELSLRQEERKMQILIEEEGDMEKADKRMEGEKELFSSTQNYLELLRNMAMYPETLQVSPLTQRFALAVLKNVVIETHSDLATSIRKQVPMEIHITTPNKIREIDLMKDWVFETRDGSNMEECKKSMKEALKKSNKERIKEMWKVRFSKEYLNHNKIKAILIAALSAGVFFYSPLMGGIGVLAGAIFYKWLREKPFYDQLKEIDPYIQTEVEATMADIVDYRHNFDNADEKADQLPTLLRPLYVKEMLQRNYDKARVIVR